jgi:hypothetical protein
MGVNLVETAVRLWHGAAAWKYTVIGAGMLTVVAAAHMLSAGSSSPVSYPSTPSADRGTTPASAMPPDPIKEAHLADYETAYAEAMKLAGAGEQCERIKDDYSALTPDERALGRNVRASSRERIAAVSGGERCEEALRVSDAHFDQFEHAVSAAITNASAQTMKAAADASARLDPFDRSRARFAGEGGLLLKVKEMSDELAASDARIAAMLSAATAFVNDRSAAAYLTLEMTLRPFSAFDRDRLTGAQRAAVGVAEQAVKDLNASRARVGKLLPHMTALQNQQTPQTEQQLFDAVAAITPLDEALASQDQKDVIAKARATTGQMAWALLQERVNAQSQGETPEGDAAVASVYALLRDIPADDANDAQRALLAKGQAATTALAESDDRLRALVSAAENWRQHGASTDPGVIAAFNAITPFDRKRFTDAQKGAWDTLSQAEAILHGPELGLTAATKQRIPIHVFSSQPGDLNRRVANAVQQGLKRNGFRMVASPKDASLVVDVSVDSIDEPAMDTTGALLKWNTVAHLFASAAWVADGSSLFADHVQAAGAAQGSEEEEARLQALRHAADAVVTKIDEFTKK